MTPIRLEELAHPEEVAARVATRAGIVAREGGSELSDHDQGLVAQLRRGEAQDAIAICRVRRVAPAVEDLLATEPGPFRILVCGSLYLAGEVLRRNG